MFKKTKDEFDEKLELEEFRIIDEMKKCHPSTEQFSSLAKQLAELNKIRNERFETINKESKIITRIEKFGGLGLKAAEIFTTFFLSSADRRHKTKLFYEEERVLKDFARWEETNMFSTTPGKILGGNMCKKFGK